MTRHTDYVIQKIKRCQNENWDQLNQQILISAVRIDIARLRQHYLLLANRLKEPFEINNLNSYMASLGACEECVCLTKNDIAIEHIQDVDKLLTSMGMSDDQVQAKLDAQPTSWGDEYKKQMALADEALRMME